MASANFSCRGSIIGGGGDEVYIAAVPLRATNGPAQVLMSAAFSLNIKHFMVIIKPSSTHEALVYDFQPEDPENLLVALAALSGSKVPGVIHVRKIGKLPKKKCWFVGFSRGNAIDSALRFNERWETKLKIGIHDCRHYSQGGFLFTYSHNMPTYCSYSHQPQKISQILSKKMPTTFQEVFKMPTTFQEVFTCI